MALAALLSLFLLKRFSSSTQVLGNGLIRKILLCLFGSLLIQAAIYVATGFNVFNATASSTDQYILHASSVGASSVGASSVGASSVGAKESSLGFQYILSQPFLIRSFVGLYYINVFPIPIWHGFDGKSIYHVFKSFNAIFMCFVIPLAVIGCYEVKKYGTQLQRLGVLFLIVVYLGFSFGVAATSLESRHLASFLMPLLIVAAVPGFDCQRKRIAYLKVFGGWMLVIGLTHLAWYSLKQMQLGLI
jgi:hypothetical protein